MADTGIESLKVWQKATALAVKICSELLPQLPKAEEWALTSQLRRSAQSIPANIAEGYGRYYYQENIRFCYIARGSLEETLSHLLLAQQLGYLSTEEIASLKAEINELRRMLNGYIAFLKRSKQGKNEPGASLVVRDDPAVYGFGAEFDERDISDK